LVWIGGDGVAGVDALATVFEDDVGVCVEVVAGLGGQLAEEPVFREVAATVGNGVVVDADAEEVIEGLGLLAIVWLVGEIGVGGDDGLEDLAGDEHAAGAAIEDPLETGGRIAGGEVGPGVANPGEGVLLFRIEADQEGEAVGDEAGDVLRGEDEIGVQEEEMSGGAGKEGGGDAVARAGDEAVSDMGGELQMTRGPADEVEEALDEVGVIAAIDGEANTETDGGIGEVGHMFC
jgi:hypothetical protein